MSVIRYPKRIESVHVESIDGDLCVYDTATQRVHALNHTAAFVWQRCDGRTTPAELTAALSAETAVDNAEAVVQLTLQELAAAQLLTAPIESSHGCRGATCSGGLAAAHPGDLLHRGADSRGSAVARRSDADEPLANKAPGATTVPVTLTGTNFVVGATTVTVNRRRNGHQRRRRQHDVADRQHRGGPGRRARRPHGDGHDGRRD